MIYRKIDSIKDAKEEQRREQNRLAAASIAFAVLAENGTIDETTASEHAAEFIPWSDSGEYKPDQIREHEGALYRCLQAHTSQPDYTPPNCPALWRRLGGDPTVEYPVWSQPICAADAYELGDKVSHNAEKWISTVEANVWEPGVYGWRKAGKEV